MSLRSIEPGIKLAVSISVEAEDDYLAFLKQMGIPAVGRWKAQTYGAALLKLLRNGRKD